MQTELNDEKKPILKLIAPEERLRLQGDVVKHIQTRELIFKGMVQDGMTLILLVHEKGNFSNSINT